MVAHPIFVNNKLFLGRVWEQLHFRTILREVIESVRSKEWPCVVLVFGSRGMGKTTLARRLQSIAASEDPFQGRFESLWVNAAEAIRSRNGENGARAEDLLEMLYQAALEKFGFHFTEYEQLAQVRRKTDREAAEALDPQVDYDDLGDLPGANAETAGKAARFLLLHKTESEEKILRGLADIGLNVSVERAGRLRDAMERRLRRRLSAEQFEFYLRPQEHLARALGEGLQKLLPGGPLGTATHLIVTLDSYETVDRLDELIRLVMLAAGPQILWILSGQNDLWRSGQRESMYYAGYSEEWPERAIPMDLSRLSKEDIRAYFSYLAPTRKLTIDELDSISRATRGIPLAIHEAAELWRRNVPLEEIIGTISYTTPDDQILRKMTETYLIDSIKTRIDQQALISLGLARAGEPAFLTAQSRADHSLAISSYRVREQEMLHASSRGSEPGEDKAWAFNCLGNAYIEQGFHEEALAAYARASELDPREAASNIGIGNVYFELGMQDDAIRAYHRAIDIDPRNAAAHYGLGNAWLEHGSREEALRAYLQANRLDPDDPYPHCGLGTAYYELGYHQEAIASFIRASELDPQDAYPHFGLGNVYSDQGFYRQAIAAYLHAIELDPRDAASHAGLGKVYSRQGLHKQAIFSYLHAAELDPEDATVHCEIGAILMTQGMLDDAVAAYRRAIEINPGVAIAHQKLGNLYRSLKRYEQAEASYRQAGELEPDDAAPFYGLGNVYSDQNLFEQAIEAFHRAAELNPGYAHTFNGLGNAYRAQGEYEKAIEAYQRAGELDTKYTYLLMSVAACYKHLDRQGEFEVAIELASEALANEDEYNRACFEAICGNVDESIELLRKAQEKNELDLEWLKKDPDFEFIRDDSRFAAFLEELRSAPAKV